VVYYKKRLEKWFYCI